MSLGERYQKWRQERAARAEEKLRRNINSIPIGEAIRRTRDRVIDESRRLPGGPPGPFR